jgi:hypothetical protein
MAMPHLARVPARVDAMLLLVLKELLCCCCARHSITKQGMRQLLACACGPSGKAVPGRSTSSTAKGSSGTVQGKSILPRTSAVKASTGVGVFEVAQLLEHLCADRLASLPIFEAVTNEMSAKGSWVPVQCR